MTMQEEMSSFERAIMLALEASQETYKNAKSFPTGGVAYGPQRALIGDNPDREEIITPDMIVKFHDQDHKNVISNKITVRLESKVPLPKIGIGITTHNRPEAFKKTLLHISDLLPENAVISIVDDASNSEYAYDICVDINVKIPSPLIHRFENNVGIACAKNKALELLYNADCEHFFLFDDDTYPLVDDWWKPYVESREPHLMYIFEHFANAKGPNDMIKVYQDEEIAAYSHVRGCMLYYKRIVLDTVGGMDVAFGKWGHEHGDLSNRIYSAGLTRFRYMDVASSKGLFYAADEQEHGKFKSTVPGAQRIDLLNKSKAIYEAQYNKPFYREFRDAADANVGYKNPLFLTAYFTTLEDTQRPGQKREFDINDTSDYRNSLYFKRDRPIDASNVILTDWHSHEVDTFCRFVNVPVYGNPYFQRWMSYYDYLIRHKDIISWVFMTDCTDVELLKMPEPERGKIYVGDEPDLIGKSTWLQYHHKHPQLQLFYKKFAGHQLVNAGILGGYMEDVLPFIRSIIDTYIQMLHESTTNKVFGPGITDMGIFNYVAYTQFADKISHGQHVNTRFKANERNDISWFKHK